jgi:hypothetical protein
VTTYAEQQKFWRAIGYTPPKGRGRCPDCGWHIKTMGHPEGCPGMKTRRKDTA